MPRGVPKAGFRKTKNWQDRVLPEPIVESFETDSEIDQKLRERFEILNILTKAAISGDCRSLIVSGPAGLGKSFTIEQALEQWDPDKTKHTVIRGYITKNGLYRTLWQHRDPGCVLVFDDADSLFTDDVSLNMLKAVCDTMETRTVSMMSEYKMYDDDESTLIPRTFEFNGTIIFISNLDFDTMAESGSKLAPHLSAMVSRSHYIDLAMKTRRDYLVRIRQVVQEGLLTDGCGLSDEESQEVMNFIESNSSKLRELSLRIAIKIATLRKTSNDSWRRIARVTCMK